MAMGLKPDDDYRPPWWFRIVQTAKYYGCHPEDVMSRSTFWIDAAAATADVENHVNEVRSQRAR